ncbi:unnamed protein product [Allacma fusca]|uniref:Uncharacterized protein n=1 Tax=Allacma fusca TaxID=39272 RepID=A0A8J2Q7F9_9HEXA|nr:unnamed protein product [Allacma fusca]
MANKNEIQLITGKIVIKIPELQEVQMSTLWDDQTVEFLDGDYFDGEVYLDLKHEQYQALGYKKYNVFNILKDICFNKDTLRTAWKGWRSSVRHNWAGNGFLTGGTIIIEKGGENVILSYKMKGLADHLKNETILEALNIPKEEFNSETKPLSDIDPKIRKRTCDENVCQL